MPAIDALLAEYEHEAVVRLVREIVGEYRSCMDVIAPAPDAGAVAARVVAAVESRWSAPKPVINATGVILHTNLGRAPLSADTVVAMRDASAYLDLELDFQSGRRGSRQRRLSWQLQALTGAESAFVAVNNAAALLLVLRALCRGRDVIVGRGEAVEIGGGMRIPQIMRESGARLVEVGTTNRTRAADYSEAMSSRAAAILRVHASNFRIVGFTESVDTAELADLARRHSVPLIVDNGSGALLDTSAFGLAHEPTPREALAAGADLVTFSGDKLLGGPQSGIILGRDDLIARLATHPLARAVRPDKVTVAGLAATLLAYLRGDATATLPVWQMISQSGEQIAQRAASWTEVARRRGIRTSLVPGESTVGGGSLPGETLPTTLIRLPPEVTAARLRAGDPSVIALTRHGRSLIDLRTVVPSQEEPLLRAAERVLVAQTAC